MGTLIQFDLAYLRRTFDCHYFVEMGSGDTESLSHAVQSRFKHCYAVEPSRQQAKQRKKQFKHLDTVSIIQKTYQKSLEKVLPSLPSDHAILFWIDPDQNTNINIPPKEHKTAVQVSLVEILKTIHRLRPASRDLFLIDDLRVYRPGPYFSGNIPPEQHSLLKTERYSELPFSLFQESHRQITLCDFHGYLILLPKKVSLTHLFSAQGQQLTLSQLLYAWQNGHSSVASALVNYLLLEREISSPLLVPLTELLRRMGRLDDALRVGQSALQVMPENPAIHNNLGLIYLDQSQIQNAEQHFRFAIKCNPDYLRARHNLAKMAITRGDLAQGETLYKEALSLQPNNPIAWNGLGSIARRRYDHDQALHCFEKALKINPNYQQAQLNQIQIWQDQNAFQRAERALIDIGNRYPNQASIYSAIGSFYDHFRRHDQAIEAYERAVQLHPHSVEFRLALIDVRRKGCDWRDDWNQAMAWLQNTIQQTLSRGTPSSLPPLNSLRYPLPPPLQRQIAEAHARTIETNIKGIPFTRPESLKAETHLNIGFLSHEFRQNVVGQFLHHLPAAFERSRFKIYGFIYNADDGSDIYKDLIAGCDHVEDIQALSPVEAAQKIVDHQIHILIDINSYMKEGRPEIAALKPAPIQISYLYPGSMGAPWIDYLLTDEIVTPEAHATYYQEKLLYLPPCYLPSTGRVTPAERYPERQHYGLPDNAFVFCSLNKEDKIDPNCFSAWLTILKAVPHSVLWLSASSTALGNLRRVAHHQGIKPARLIAVRREPDMAVHLARLRYADLFLDTFIHTAHVTAADALWAGLPVLTLLGPNYAGRVAASLLTAANMSELIAHDKESYIKKAVALTHPNSPLKRWRQNWEQQRTTHPLFNADLLARNLGECFESVWDNHKRSR
ncbi:O-linked N-acetylglucosamine transferase family protein [Magnetococcales bacterium HHB-1]